MIQVVWIQDGRVQIQAFDTLQIDAMGYALSFAEAISKTCEVVVFDEDGHIVEVF